MHDLPNLQFDEEELIVPVAGPLYHIVGEREICHRCFVTSPRHAIDITESVQLLVCFAALRSMPVMPNLEHYNVDAMHAMAAAALATQAAAANARPRPRLAGQCE